MLHTATAGMSPAEMITCVVAGCIAATGIVLCVALAIRSDQKARE